MYTHLLKIWRLQQSWIDQAYVNKEMVALLGGGIKECERDWQIESRTACTEVFMGGLVSSCLGKDDIVKFIMTQPLNSLTYVAMEVNALLVTRV